MILPTIRPRRPSQFWATARFGMVAFAVALAMGAVQNRFGARIDRARIAQTRVARLHERAGAVLNDLDSLLLGERIDALDRDLERLHAGIHAIMVDDGAAEIHALHAAGTAFIEVGRKQMGHVKAGRLSMAMATDRQETDPAYDRLEAQIEARDRLYERQAMAGIRTLTAASGVGLFLCAALVTGFAARHRQKVSRIAELEGLKLAESSRALLQAQVESSVDGILIVDPAGKILLQNRRMGEIWGIPDEMLRSDDDAKQIAYVMNSLKNPEEFVATVESLYANPRQTRYDQIELKNGKVIDRHTGPAAGPDGDVYGRIWIFRDVTDRVRAENALRANESRLHTLMESMPQLVWSALPDGWNLYLNQQWHDYTGQTPDESAGTGWKACIHPDDLREGGLHADTDAVFEVESRLRRADGVYRWFLVRGVPVADASGQVAHWFGTCTDIDDLKLSEELLRQAREELEDRVERRTRDLVAATKEAERANAAKSEFLSRMSHELRTPMNAILGFGQILQRQALSEGQRESVDYILKGGRHLLSLINEILDLSRVEAGRTDLSIEPVPLAELVDESLAMIRHAAADRGLAVEENRALFEGVVVRADRQRLKQVLINLLSNAVKYNRPQGRIAIGLALDGETVRIAVEDTGHGISEEGRAKLFTPFERLDAGLEVEGTGLGLFLTQKLVLAMGGALAVQSEVGRGSTFFVEFARAQAPADAFLAAQGAAHAPGIVGTSVSGSVVPEASDARPRRILSIEDNSANTRLLEMIVASYPGVTLQTATQAFEGLVLARRAEPDLILLDLNLPDMHGLQVLERLRRSAVTARIPVVVLSADVSPGVADAALAAGADAFLAKPLDAERLLQTLAPYLADPNDRADDRLAREAA